MRTLEGTPAAPGVAIGQAIQIENRPLDVYRIPLPEADLDAEVQRLLESVAQAREEIRHTASKVRQSLGDELADIFEAHALLVADEAFVGRIVETIREQHVNAEWAVHTVAAELGAQFAEIESEHLRARGEDLHDVSLYLLRSLLGVAHHEISELDTDVVIVGHDLTPSEAVRLGRERVVGFAIEGGGLTSHTTIIARSLNLPLLVGVEGVTEAVEDEDPVVLDGGRGLLILHPTASKLDHYRQQQVELARRDEELAATRELPSTTRDDVPVKLMANVDLPEEIDEALRFGAEGIGLYRSEFLYIERSPELPSEDEHAELYGRLLESMAPHPVVIRTYDLGGRKLAREMMHTAEDNPVLGLRGIRLTLARPEIFRVQLRALLRAGAQGKLRLLLPLVSAIDEILEFRRVLAEVGEELASEGLPYQRDYELGIMIEVPSAAVVADLLAPHVDFFSIGTNDLIQYSLAVDRNNEHVAYLYRPMHPAILRMIRFVVASAREAGIDVSICGEMAADPRYAALLVGMGLRTLSVTPRSVPALKALVRGACLDELEALATECLELPNAAAVEERLDRLTPVEIAT